MDRFFTAPYLASGNPKQIAEAMWRELDEIRQPVLQVSHWLERQDEECLEKMIHPKTREEIPDSSISEAEFMEELEKLSLEAFLALL